MSVSLSHSVEALPRNQKGGPKAAKNQAQATIRKKPFGLSGSRYTPIAQGSLVVLCRIFNCFAVTCQAASSNPASILILCCAPNRSMKT